MDAQSDRKQLADFFKKSYKQFIRDEKAYYPDKIGYRTGRLNLCSEREDLLENVLFEFFEDIQRVLFMTDFELNVMIQNAISSYLASVKHYTKRVMFLTWRPAEEMPLKVFRDITIKLIEKKIISEYIIVFEQKGNSYSSIGQGKHIHVLLKFHYNRPYTEYKKQIKKYFYETHKQHKKSIDIVDIDKKEYIYSKLYYMGYLYQNGEILINENLTYKKGEDVLSTNKKLECLQYDRLFQRKNNLMDSIENNNRYMLE